MRKKKQLIDMREAGKKNQVADFLSGARGLLSHR
jgi:hypothetical protein